MSPNRERLEQLQKEGKFLFHGSDAVIEEFEPRQAHNTVNGKQVPDGEPAIFASPSVDYAIFMAIINRTNCPKGFRSGCAQNNGELTFSATKKTLDQLTPESSGYVYVFRKIDFTHKHESEWVSYTKVKPIEVIEVTWADFTQKVHETSE